MGKTAELNFVALEEKGGGDLTGRKNATNYTRVERERTIRRRRRQQMAKKLNAHRFCTSKETQGAPVKNGTCMKGFSPNLVVQLAVARRRVMEKSKGHRRRGACARVGTPLSPRTAAATPFLPSAPQAGGVRRK